MAEIGHYKTSLNGKKEVKVHIASGAVVIENNKILLCREEDDWWVTPGGTLDENETLVENVHRECEEELGLKVEVTGKAEAYIFQTDERMILLFYYPAKRTNKEIIKGDEIEEWGWFGIDELPENTSPGVRFMAEKFLGV